MPGAAARWAAVLALAVLAAGCKPSSLSPFSGEQGLAGGESINGVWGGSTSGGGVLRFSVGDRRIGNLQIQHFDGRCSRIFIMGEAVPVDAEGDFAVVFELADGGRFGFEGSFTSTSTCAGTYYFEQVSIVGTCPRSGSGSFTAGKSG